MDNSRTPKQERDRGLEDEPQRKAYEPPAVVTYGSVDELTRAIGSVNTDGLGGSAIL